MTVVYLLHCLLGQPCTQTAQPDTWAHCNQMILAMPKLQQAEYMCQSRSIPAIDITKFKPGFQQPPGH